MPLPNFQNIYNQFQAPQASQSGGGVVQNQPFAGIGQQIRAAGFEPPMTNAATSYGGANTQKVGQNIMNGIGSLTGSNFANASAPTGMQGMIDRGGIFLGQNYNQNLYDPQTVSHVPGYGYVYNPPQPQGSTQGVGNTLAGGVGSVVQQGQAGAPNPLNTLAGGVGSVYNQMPNIDNALAGSVTGRTDFRTGQQLGDTSGNVATGMGATTQNPLNALAGGVSSIYNQAGPPAQTNTDIINNPPGAELDFSNAFDYNRLNQGYDQVYDFYQQFPQMLDEYTSNRVNRDRIRYDDTIGALTEAANLRASRGLQGGTEPTNIQAGLLSNLERDRQNRIDQYQREDMQNRLAGMAGLQSHLGTGSGYGSNWANILTNMIRQGYVGA